MSIELKATILGLGASLAVLGLTFGFSLLLQPAKAAGSTLDRPVDTVSNESKAALNEEVKKGHDLFDRNCAHCHGDDAHGDEGPSLYDLSKSDTRIAKNIKEGIKGEMPKFSTKLNDADVQALIAYLRTLKD
jgi:mono/diheme cytochrome c family protein